MYLSFLHYLTLCSHWAAQRPSINATFSCVEKEVYFTNTPSFFLFFFFEKTMRLEQQGAVPWKICCSLSSSVSLALSYSRCHSFSFSFPSVTTRTSGCLCKISGESIWVLSYMGPGSVTAWPKEACSFPWTLPLRSGRVELGSPLIDNVSIDGVATTVGFLCSECFLPIHLTHVTSKVAHLHFKTTDFLPWQKC